MSICLCLRPEEEIVDDYDAIFGEEEPTPTAQNMVAFGEDAISDTQTEADVQNLEGKHKIPLQTMKEQLLGTVSLMHSLMTSDVECDLRITVFQQQASSNKINKALDSNGC